MDKLKKYSGWLKILFIIALIVALAGAGRNLFSPVPHTSFKTCESDNEIEDYGCWIKAHAEDVNVTESLGIKSSFIWLPLFAVAMFGYWNVIQLMGSFHKGLIFTHENFLRMRWIARVHLGLYFGEELYVSLTQLLAHTFAPHLTAQARLHFATGSSPFLPGLLFLIMAYAVQAAAEMKQELEHVV